MLTILNRYVWIYLVCVNAFAFVLFGIDKQRARQGRWRISEKTLLTAAALGGSPGALAGMYLFHHKTKKKSFYLGIPAILLLELTGIGVVWYFLI